MRSSERKRGSWGIGGNAIQQANQSLGPERHCLRICDLKNEKRTFGESKFPVAAFLLDSFLLTMGLVNKMEGILKHGQITLLDSEMHPGKQQTLQVLLRHLPRQLSLR